MTHTFSLSVFYFAVMILSVIRLTELFTLDGITVPLRARFKWDIWTCPRCISVWASMTAVVLWWFFPVANVPLALSAIYILYLQAQSMLFGYGMRRIVIAVDRSNNIHIDHQSLLMPDFKKTLERIVNDMNSRESRAKIESARPSPPTKQSVKG